MAKTAYKVYEAELNYAQVFERNMDHGGEDNDAAAKVKAQGGQTKVTMIVTEEVKDRMIADGIPDVSLGHQMFKPNGDGRWVYIAKRPWNSPFTDEDGNPVDFGEPNVIDYVATKELFDAGDKDAQVKWDSDVNIGNGSKGLVKLFIWANGTKRIVRLESVAITELVEWTGDGGVRF